MITIDVTMLIQIVNILVLIVIMNAILYRPVRTILEQRGRKIADLQKDIETYNKNAKLRLDEFDQKVREARSKAKAEMETLRGDAQASGADQVASVRKDYDAKKSEQFGQIQAQFASVRQELQGQIEGFAREMASKVMGRSL
ncbi:MAG: ATP synthase F0 subunit B [Desulfobacteraceae bacterium]|nr:ATP synthase F0 subunit B [Desulfobacteraceae bacterium]